MKTFKYKKEAILVVIGLLIVAAVHYAYLRRASQTEEVPSNAATRPAGPIEVRGKMTCLPHRDTNGPQTLECAFGLQDDTGLYYALHDTDPEYKNIANVPMDAVVIVRGTFTPKNDEKYQSIGIIDVTEVAAADAPRRATLTGTYMCLLHKDANGPQTDECAIGMKTDDGFYYALDLSSQTPPQLTVGDRIRASGAITPIERLSTDHWQKYQVDGIFSVTDWLVKLED